MQFLFWLGWEKSIDRLSCFPSFWACLSICSLHVDMIEAKGCVRWWYKVCSTYVNDKVPKGNGIHARMDENSLAFLSFFLVFNCKLVSMVLRVTLLVYYFEKFVKMYKYFSKQALAGLLPKESFRNDHCTEICTKLIPLLNQIKHQIEFHDPGDKWTKYCRYLGLSADSITYCESSRVALKANVRSR